MKGKIDNSAVTQGGFSTPFSIMNRTTRQKTHEETEDFYNTITHQHLTDIYRILHLTTE